MAGIRDYIYSQLIEPLKQYPTTMQDTLLSIITSRIEELYEYTKKFPEIISPNSNRLDILQAIMKQFEFSIREEADLREQISILDNILELYNKRGSIDTIENMWKYYGGDLPKEVKVNIPSYNLFRYSISKFSGNNVFPDNGTNRSGVYEIVLYNSNYPIDKLKDFMLRELVAAGNAIYFTNSLYSHLTGDSSYNYDVSEDTLKLLNMRTVSYRSGLKLSGVGGFSKNTKSSLWSGRPDLFFELSNLRELGEILLGKYSPYDILIVTEKPETVHYSILVRDIVQDTFFHKVTSYTPVNISNILERYLYDIEGNLISSSYPGYFVLGETLLGNEVL